MLVVVGHSTSVAEDSQSDLKVLRKFVYRILELGFGGTGHIYIAGVILLLWFCGLSFPFYMLLVFFYPSFKNI